MSFMKRSLSSPVRTQTAHPSLPRRARQSIDYRDERAETRLSPPQPLQSSSQTSSTLTLPIRQKGTAHLGDEEPASASVNGAPASHETVGSQDISHKTLDPDDPFTEPLSGPPKAHHEPKSHTSVLRTPLLEHTSLFSNNYIHHEDEGTTLEELAHLVRLSKYQQRKCAITRSRLQRTLISTALSARLIRCGDVAVRNLADCFRKDDKEGFAALYNAIQDVRKSCDEMRRFALLEPDMSPLVSPAPGSSETLQMPANPPEDSFRPVVPFLDDIAASSRETFVNFLTEIRTNPDYLATRICSLRSSELQVFLLPHKGLEAVDSAMGGHRLSSNRSHSSLRSQSNLEIDRLLSFHRRDPLSILIHTCFANSAGPESNEDRRRTDVWATTLARLITEPKSNSEQFVITVMSIWINLREWSGKSSIEWFLIRILEDGAFLLDPAEDQHGTRFNLSDWTQSDEEAAKAFYSRAVDDLFELVDDSDAAGIPDGLLELGNAMLSKLDEPKYLQNTSRWLVWRCLFSVFLVGAIIHPESYGMLTEYHITPYAREKILKKVALKAQEYVSSMWNGKPPAGYVLPEIPHHIKAHITSIVTKFQGQDSGQPRPRLLPARSITSLRETAEVHPYLVISPSEIVSIVNALFPERRPLSTASTASGPFTVATASAISSPRPMSDERNAAEIASIISTSASSTQSDFSNNQDPHSRQSSTPIPSPSALGATEAASARKLRRYEEDGYQLRLAIYEMAQRLGHDALNGTIHPCAERWAVLFLTADGRALSTDIGYDPSEDADEVESWTSSDAEDDRTEDDMEGDEDFHQLRDSVLRLVEDFEIPQGGEVTSGSTYLSNRASRLRRYRSKNLISSPERAGPRRQSQTPLHSPQKGRPPANDEAEPILITMLKAAAARSTSQNDFVSAHVYWRTLSQLECLDADSLSRNGYSALINIFSRGPRDSVRRSTAAIEEFDAWLIWLKQSQERHEGFLSSMAKRSSSLRDKMWYVTDVRNSKEYNYSRDICQALKAMGMPRRWNLQRSRARGARGSSTSYLYRTESQIMDLLAATEDQGGPNKLRDDQAEMAAQWLKQNGVENFCQGEERIHRFCCEIDKCISKLIGETIHDAPVLWSSDLYRRDKLVFERSQRFKTPSLFDDASSVTSSDDQRFPSMSHRSASASRDFRSWSSHSLSQKSFESLRMTTSRPLSDHHDTRNYFEKLSTADGIDSGAFWSPFEPVMSPLSAASQAHSPTTSLTNLSATFSGTGNYNHFPSSSSVSTGRPVTSASSSGTVSQRRATEGKTKFLQELRLSLTSLILSDLGNSVLSKGSETDQWFQGLGQECIDRKEALDARAKSKAGENDSGSISATRHRVIEKKKSFGDLRGAGDIRSASVPEPAVEQPSPTASNTPTEPSVILLAKSAPKSFPFRKAYERLLVMFRVHPNPMSKLLALKELEDLIIASVSPTATRSRRSRRYRSDGTPGLTFDNTARKSQVLDQTINNAKQRRSSMMQPSNWSLSSAYQHDSAQDSRSAASKFHAHLDAVTREFQKLFRDADIRPGALFRDLQLIAAFVPPPVLDKPELGRAFWNASLAALMLKAEVCNTMVEMADDIVAARTHTRPAADSSTAQASAPVSSTGTPPPPSTTHTLEDAGRMWTITAKEGSATAQRELALFYLSNPELVERTTLPLSKPREVFKQSVMNKYGRGTSTSVPASTSDSKGSSGKGGADVRIDPGLMCVAVHWMGAAERGGDELAMSFLRQNEFMDMK